MCTASWWFAGDGGYELFFNRDEQKSRAVGELPQPGATEGVRYLAPRDGKRGGTWLMANDAGVTCCLVNHYPGGDAFAGSAKQSRGELVLGCASAADVAEIVKRIRATALARYSPFYLLALAPKEEARLLTWDGRMLEEMREGIRSPVTSSAFETKPVVARRREAYAEHGCGAAGVDVRQALERFHDQHDPQRGAYSVCMNRPDACTVSQIRVRVDAENVTMLYRAFDWTRSEMGSAGGSRTHWTKHSLVRRAPTVVP